MAKAGLAEEIIATAMQSAAERAVDLSADGLIELKTAGVSDRLIWALQHEGQLPAQPAIPALAVPTQTEPAPRGGASRALVKAGTTTPDLSRLKEPGIYLQFSGKWTQVEPNVVTVGGTSAGNLALAGLTMGFKKIKVKASLRESKAQLRVDPVTDFYFYGTNGFNPNEFVLARFETNDSNRMIVAGEAGMMGAKSGIRDEDQVKVTISKIDTGLYKVVPAKDLRPGEYAFINLSDSKSQKVWDFGVDK